MNEKQLFLDLLTDPDKHYLRTGVAKFKDILHDKMFDYKAEFKSSDLYRSRFRYVITVTTDDQDALDDLDKYFVLCFTQVMHLVAIKPMQFSSDFERNYIIRKDFRRGQ